MTKNRDREPFGDESPMENNQTIVVLNEHGEVIGKTYPKRAKGLIKKGRAEFLSDTVLRLKDFCPTEKSEEIIMDNNVINNIQNQETAAAVDTATTFKGKHEYILFDPRKWYNNPDTANMNRCERYMYQSPDGSMSEIYTLGDWNGHWSEIRSRFIPVDSETDYTFVFWLNGGENDRRNEVCRMMAVYTNTEQQKIPDEDWSQLYIYKLNRGGVKPIKNIDGWYLFAIDLPKPDKKFLELRFVAQSAPMALRAAEEPSAYDGLEDRPDEFEDRRPQRHNIFFADGWPEDSSVAAGCWYSTGNLRRQREAGVKNDGQYCSSYKLLFEKEAGEKNESDGYAEKVDEVSHLLKPVADWRDMWEGVNVRELRLRLDELSGTLRSGFSFGKEAKVERMMNDLKEQFKRLKNCTSTVGNVRISNVAAIFLRFYNELKGNFRRVSEPSGDFESALKAALEAADVVSQITDNLDLSDIAGNIDISEIADNIDTDEIADMVIDNIDMDEIAEQVADNIDVDEIAEHVKDSIDLDEIAEQVADNIDLDDLAEKIAERLDIKGLLREILDD